MTKEEEIRFIWGPWPWRLPGLVIVGKGVLVDVPPRDRPVTGESRSESFMDNHWDAFSEVEDLDLKKLEAQISLTRDQLSEEWILAKRLGEQVERRFERFRDRMAQSLGPQANADPDSESTDESDVGSPIWPDVWDEHVFPESHLAEGELAEGGLYGLKDRVRKLNHVADHYRVLMMKRRDRSFGRSTETVPRKTKVFAVAAAKEMKEGAVETQSGVCRGVGVELGASRRTVERWLTKKNPYYSSSGDSEEETYEAFKAAVERVDQLVGEDYWEDIPFDTSSIEPSLPRAPG